MSLTPAGRSLVDGVTDLRRSEIAHIVSRIPVELRGPAVDALDAFAEAAGEVPQQSWTISWS